MTAKEFETQLALGTLTEKTIVRLANQTQNPLKIWRYLAHSSKREVQKLVVKNTYMPISILNEVIQTTLSDNDWDRTSAALYNAFYRKRLRGEKIKIEIMVKKEKSSDS